MGYETKMYVGQVPNLHTRTRPFPDDDGLMWVQIVGMIDLCKCGYKSHTFKLISQQSPEDPVVFFYGDDGNTKIAEDRYGEPLGVISIPDMIEAMKRDLADDPDYQYRRYVAAIAFLEGIAATFTLSNTFVITFGH